MIFSEKEKMVFSESRRRSSQRVDECLLRGETKVFSKRRRRSSQCRDEDHLREETKTFSERRRRSSQRSSNVLLPEDPGGPFHKRPEGPINMDPKYFSRKTRCLLVDELKLFSKINRKSFQRRAEGFFIEEPKTRSSYARKIECLLPSEQEVFYRKTRISFPYRPQGLLPESSSGLKKSKSSSPSSSEGLLIEGPKICH